MAPPSRWGPRMNLLLLLRKGGLPPPLRDKVFFSLERDLIGKPLSLEVALFHGFPPNDDLFLWAAGINPHPHLVERMLPRISNETIRTAVYGAQDERIITLLLNSLDTIEPPDATIWDRAVIYERLSIPLRRLLFSKYPTPECMRTAYDDDTNIILSERDPHPPRLRAIIDEIPERVAVSLLQRGEYPITPDHVYQAMMQGREKVACALLPHTSLTNPERFGEMASGLGMASLLDRILMDYDVKCPRSVPWWVWYKLKHYRGKVPLGVYLSVYVTLWLLSIIPWLVYHYDEFTIQHPLSYSDMVDQFMHLIRILLINEEESPPGEGE